MSALQRFQRAGFRDALADRCAQRQHGRGRNGQLIDPDGQEGGQHAHIRAQLAADADPDAGLVGCVRRHLECAQHGGVMGVEELAQVIGLAVAGKGVLGQFYFSNNILPKSQVKLWALIFSLKQKAPELEIPVGEFYDGIDGYKLMVGKKNMNTGLLRDLMIYDYSDGFKNAKVMVADSGRIYFTADKKYLLLELYVGESFENLNRNQHQNTISERNIPYRREQFAHKRILIDFDMDFNRYTEDALADQHVSKNVTQLVTSIDSVKVLGHVRSKEQSQVIITKHYFGRERVAERNIDAYGGAKEMYAQYNIDSLYQTFTVDERYRAASAALDKAKEKKDKIDYNALMLDDYQRYIRKHEIELYRKFTLAFACLIFFFIGAPLGAITRKGGLGAPVVISVVMFLVYYIIDNTGYKMAREALWPCWAGMWLSTLVLIPIGVFLTYKATTDSAIFNPDAWLGYYRKAVGMIKRAFRTLKKLSVSSKKA